MTTGMVLEKQLRVLHLDHQDHSTGLGMNFLKSQSPGTYILQQGHTCSSLQIAPLPGDQALKSMSLLGAILVQTTRLQIVHPSVCLSVYLSIYLSIYLIINIDR